jgi:hypothetical protein
MRLKKPLLAVAALVALAAPAAAFADPGWGPDDGGWSRREWREHQWREHEWREHHGWDRDRAPGGYGGAWDYYAAPPYDDGWRPHHWREVRRTWDGRTIIIER